MELKDPNQIIPWRLRQALLPLTLSGGMCAFRYGFRNSHTFRWLRAGWGNEGWSADTSYLEAVCHWASRVRGPILECGSGLTTLLLGMIVPDQVTTLEHIHHWKERVQQAAREHSIPVNVLAAPLVDFGGFHWYSLPRWLPRDIELVICDGPPGQTIGGRYGLLPVAKSLLSPNAVILMDDVERSSEQTVIERWRREFGARCEEFRTRDGTYAEIRAAEIPQVE